MVHHIIKAYEIRVCHVCFEGKQREKREYVGKTKTHKFEVITVGVVFPPSREKGFFFFFWNISSVI